MDTSIKLLIILALVVGGWASVSNMSPLKAQQIISSSESVITVTTQGHGTSFESALEQALYLAVGEVNGAQISKDIEISDVVVSYVAEMAVSSSPSKLYTVESSGRYQAQSANNYTRYRSGGVIESFKVTSTKIVRGEHIVKIEANVKKFTKASYEASAVSKRLKIAVLPVKYSPSVANSMATIRLNDIWNRTLVDAFVNSNKLALVDRDFDNQIYAELKKLDSSSFKGDEAAKLGNRLGADYLLVARIDQVRIRKNQRTLALSGKTITGKPFVSLEVGFRLIETATGVVELSKSYSYTNVQGVTPDDLIQKGARSAGRIILERLFPLRVEKISGNTVYLGLGEGSVVKGDEFEIIKEGAPIIDSYTGEVLGRERASIGVIEITSVMPKLAVGNFIDRVDNAPTVSSKDKLIAEPIEEAEERIDRSSSVPNNVSPANNNANEVKGVEELQDQHEDDY